MHKNAFHRFISITCLPIAMTACSSFDAFTAEFEQNWAEPPVQVVPQGDAEAVGALTDLEQAELRAELEMLDIPGNCDRVRLISTRLITSSSEQPMATSKLADCAYAEGDYASARLRYEEWLGLEQSAEAYAGLGLSYLQGGDLERAELALKQAIELNPSVSWQAHNGLGYIQDQAKHWKAAEESYGMAAELASSSGVPYNNLGMSYMRQERYEEAVSVFSRALQRSPDLHVARLNLRTAYAMTGDFPMAYAGATDAERASILNSSGVAALADGDVDGARKLFSQALSESAVFYPNAFSNLERAQLHAARQRKDQGLFVE